MLRALSLQCCACNGACLASARGDWVVRPNYDWTVPQVCSAGWYQDRACSGSEPYRISNSRHELRVGLCRAFQGPEHMKSSSSGAGPCISADSSSELGACSRAYCSTISASGSASVLCVVGGSSGAAPVFADCGPLYPPQRACFRGGT